MARYRVESEFNTGVVPARDTAQCRNCKQTLDVEHCRAHAVAEREGEFDYDCRCGEILTIASPAHEEGAEEAADTNS